MSQWNYCGWRLENRDLRVPGYKSSFLVFDAIVRYTSMSFDIGEGYMKHIDLMVFDLD
ncbi:MAG: hypothetical protein Q7U40_13930 [Desulfatirhabdiaceae bacterium]|nr:hypothetical protein [Desulfatirhabdiaceae bacterium]